jgi:hypothetical protein
MIKQLELITEWNSFKEGDRIAHINAPNTAIATIAEIDRSKVWITWTACPTSSPTGFPKFRFKEQFAHVTD